MGSGSAAFILNQRWRLWAEMGRNRVIWGGCVNYEENYLPNMDVRRYGNHWLIKSMNSKFKQNNNTVIALSSLVGIFLGY